MRVRWFALISYFLLELITASAFAKSTQKQHHARVPKQDGQFEQLLVEAIFYLNQTPRHVHSLTLEFSLLLEESIINCTHAIGMARVGPDGV